MYYADQLAQLFSSELTSLLDRLTTRRRPSDPWFDQECRQAKRDVRRSERSSRLRCTSEATAAWYSHRREYQALLRRKSEHFGREKIYAENSTPRQLWRSIDALWVVDMYHLLTTSSPNSFIATSMKRSQVSDQRRPTPRRRLSHHAVLTLLPVSSSP